MAHVWRKFGKVVEGVEYTVRRNGKVFWYYQNEAVFDALAQHEFRLFETEYPAEHWPYHSDYYLTQMFGPEARADTLYLMPIYEAPWDISDEKRAIFWAEWTRYYHRMAMNDEIRQAANEMAYREGSLLWGPQWQSGFAPADQHEHNEDQSSHAHVQDQDIVDLEAGAQQIMTLLHITPELSPSKSQQTAKLVDQIASPTPQKYARETIKTPSPPLGCLKARADSNSSGTGSVKSIRSADEVFLLELTHRGGRNSTGDQQEEIISDQQSDEHQVSSEKCVTESQEPESVELEKNGLLSPERVHRSRSQARENSHSETQGQESLEKEQHESSEAGVKGIKVKDSHLDVNAQPLVIGETIQTEHAQPVKTTIDAGNIDGFSLQGPLKEKDRRF
ncbi:hypothetical protein QBC36DRAFT_293060 [Triangularia setosa]|uniref:Uncharacterized protein n=1 Tax=Triangularia setosa TaxID=2587417 RepID=A0AAN6W278_9PEZI|nr:hypothetical protein QBC36DRAFT_293060 [Podospora setosa]